MRRKVLRWRRVRDLEIGREDSAASRVREVCKPDVQVLESNSLSES